MPFAPGLRLAGRYVLTGRVGVGGMAEVWRADDQVLGRAVAVKALASPLAADPRLRATTRSEARAAARLAHPHIMQVFDYGEATLTGGEVVPFLVMELVQGQSLAVRLQAGPLPWQDAVRIGAEIADALAAAHRLGVVHRDIKPGNVMLTPTGAKVLDFGIAALASGRADGDGGVLVGTPAYAAPERLRRGPPDPAADVYSLGTLLYQCLTGRTPRRIDSWAEVDAGQAVPVPPLDVPGLPAEVASLVDRCLQPEPGLRPSSAQLAQTLAAAAGLPGRHSVPGHAAPAYGVAAVPHPTAVESMPPDADLRTAMGARRAPGRLGLVGALGAVVAAALVALLVLASFLGRSDPGTTLGPGDAQTSAPAEVPATSAAPVSSDPAAVIAALQQSIEAGVAAGEIDAEAAEDLRDLLQDLRRRLERGKPGQVADRADDLLKKIDEREREDQIDPQRAAELRALLEPLAAQRDGGGDDDG